MELDEALEQLAGDTRDLLCAVASAADVVARPDIAFGTGWSGRTPAILAVARAQVQLSHVVARSKERGFFAGLRRIDGRSVRAEEIVARCISQAAVVPEIPDARARAAPRQVEVKLRAPSFLRGRGEGDSRTIGFDLGDAGGLLATWTAGSTDPAPRHWRIESTSTALDFNRFPLRAFLALLDRLATPDAWRSQRLVEIGAAAAGVGLMQAIVGAFVRAYREALVEHARDPAAERDWPEFRLARYRLGPLGARIEISFDEDGEPASEASILDDNLRAGIGVALEAAQEGDIVRAVATLGMPDVLASGERFQALSTAFADRAVRSPPSGWSPEQLALLRDRSCHRVIGRYRRYRRAVRGDGELLVLDGRRSGANAIVIATAEVRARFRDDPPDVEINAIDPPWVLDVAADRIAIPEDVRNWLGLVATLLEGWSR
ncbi:MAG: hypothetical protein FJX57_00715 [Alphaproteobacteria bacterium]|nr:hypothetical protein [Alphaproteobacteria bacterium]